MFRKKSQTLSTFFCRKHLLYTVKYSILSQTNQFLQMNLKRVLIEMKIFAWYRNSSLLVLNFSAFVLGCIAGLILWKIGASCGDAGICTGKIITFLEPFGNVLVSMLKMIVIPIIFFSLICGAASLPLKEFGKMGVAVMIWYFTTSLFAAVFGSFIALVCNPTLQNAQTLAADMMTKASSMQQTAASGGSPLVDLIMGLFMNPFQALAQGQFLPVIVFSLLFGLAARTILDRSEDADTCNGIRSMLGIFDAAQKTVFQIVNWVMRYFPIGIFALTVTAFARYGLPLLQSYMQVASCVILGILLMIFVCYPLMIFIICRENPYPILWKLREPILTAFVTRSSAAALPVSIRTATEKMNIRKEFAGFTLSLGATVNMDGVCIHLPAFAVLAANLFGFTMGPWQIVLLVISVVFASIGAGGVPGGSIFLLFLVLECLHLTPEQVSLIVALALGINPLLDMFETACNVAGDNIGTCAIGKRLNLFNKKD